jgi:tyrosyl-tRNA synthetase
MWADDFFANLGLCASKGEARRLIQGGGARLNDVVVEDIKQTIDISLFSKGPVKVSAGKKKHIIVSYSCN